MPPHEGLSLPSTSGHLSSNPASGIDEVLRLRKQTEDALLHLQKDSALSMPPPYFEQTPQQVSALDPLIASSAAYVKGQHTQTP